MSIKIIFSVMSAVAFYFGVSSCHPVLASTTAPLTTESAKAFFQRFDANSSAVLNEVPAKYNSQGQRIYRNKFNFKNVSNGKFIEAKDQFRNQFCPQNKAGQACVPESQNRFYAGYDWSNSPTTFLEDGEDPTTYSSIQNLKVLSDKAGFQGKAATQPWSGDYWPTYKGGIGSRLYDERFPVSMDWKDYWNFYTGIMSIELQSNMYEKGYNSLSPAEKYDILLGLDNHSLTTWSWNESKSNENADGIVETWFGLCHGWAPASFMVPRPTTTTEVALADGNTIKFYPDDIKALATLAWARNRMYDSDNFMGGRCNDKAPKKDNKGRIISSECWDVNPGAWHVAVLNRLGVDKKSFILDATYDYEVWNQPINSFQVRYFNLNTKEEFNNPKDAVIKKSEFSKDAFKSYRNRSYKNIVGVKMTIGYMSETLGSAAEFDDPQYDHFEHVTYMYDLELDEDLNIIGGEWYNNAHPDFVWFPRAGTEAKSISEYKTSLTDWKLGQPLTTEQKQAITNDANNGYPFIQIIEKLLNKDK